MLEKLIQYTDLLADENIRKIALAKNDSKLLAIVSRHLVAAEACYHGTCYREYTRPKPETGTSWTLSFTSQDDEYACTESAEYGKLSDYVRNNVFETPNLIRLPDLTRTMISYMKDLGIKETKESFKTHLRRKLETQFGSLLQFEDLLGNNRVFITPANLSLLQLAKEVVRLQQLQYKGQASLMDGIRRVALELRKAICCKQNEMSWPPKPSKLTEEEINLPDEVRVFLATLLTGNSKYPGEPCSSKVQRLVNSFGQDMVFGVTGGRNEKPPKHILPPYAVKTLTNNLELIQSRFLTTSSLTSVHHLPRTTSTD